MEKTTDEMLLEIVSYKYECLGFPFVFLDYNQDTRIWSVTWRNPDNFGNAGQTYSRTPNEACKKALEFIKNNPQLFKKEL